MAKRKKYSTEDKVKFLEGVGAKYAKELKENATTYELKLYKHLKDLHYQFLFQVPVICAKKHLYILDFLIPEYNLVIEADSKLYHGSKKDQKSDALRTRRLKKEGYSVIRFWNNQITKFTKEVIDQIIKQRINMLNINKDL